MPLKCAVCPYVTVHKDMLKGHTKEVHKILPDLDDELDHFFEDMFNSEVSNMRV